MDSGTTCQQPTDVKSDIAHLFPFLLPSQEYVNWCWELELKDVLMETGLKGIIEFYAGNVNTISQPNSMSL
ncbi:hypothetical protein C5167_010140 [Papaver somniferum]|uniref:Uncharacterized protein n=1 Tax=Papaver somniferum TaxID=3469 RepID=A0A4Y7JZE3_PAPSO|nr:hypothetical protein C5167_010140 [Papaver somniferum]